MGLVLPTAIEHEPDHFFVHLSKSMKYAPSMWIMYVKSVCEMHSYIIEEIIANQL